MRICLMIEGQEGVSWPSWRALARACEDHGLEGLFRSDHYLSVEDRRERGSLDAWSTLNALAAITERIRLGTLVSPTSFRHPSVLAKSVVTADHVSGGRVELGLGAGWWAPEHDLYGFPFRSTGERMDELERQLGEIHAQWGADHEAMPKPLQRPRVPIVLGGGAGPRSARLAARYADEYNTIFAPPEACAERRAAVRAACAEAGREPLPFSLMTGCVIGADRAEVDERLRRVAELHRPGATVADLRAQGWIVGTSGEAVEQLRALERAGVERVMLQHLLHDDVDAVALIGRALVPALR